MDGNTETLFGIGLYGANLETTYTGHHPVLVYFEQVSPAEPEPEPPTPEPPPEPYTLVARLNQAPHGFEDLREQVRSVTGVNMEAVTRESFMAGRISESGAALFGKLDTIVLHHMGAPYYDWEKYVQQCVREGLDTAEYHFVVEKSGAFKWLVALKYVVYGAYGVNHRAIHICFEDGANERQMETGRFLIAALYELMGQDWGAFRLMGLVPHFMVWNGEKWQTACPGAVWPKILWSGPWPDLRRSL